MELVIDEEEIQKNFPSDEEEENSQTSHIVHSNPPLSPEPKSKLNSQTSETSETGKIETSHHHAPRPTTSDSSETSSSDSEPVPPRKKRRRRIRKLSTTEEESEAESKKVTEEKHSPTVQVQHNSFPAPNNRAFKIQKTCFLSLCALRDYRIDPDGGIANVYFEGVTIPNNYIGNIVPVEDLKAKNVEMDGSSPLLLFGDSRKKGFWLKFCNHGKDRVILRHSQALVSLFLTKAEPFFVTHKYRYESASQAQSMGLAIEGTTLPWQRKESRSRHPPSSSTTVRSRSRSPPKCRRPHRRYEESDETWRYEQNQRLSGGGYSANYQERRQRYFPSRQQSSYHTYHSAGADYVDSDYHRPRHGMCENYGGWRHSGGTGGPSAAAPLPPPPPARSADPHCIENSKYYL